MSFGQNLQFLRKMRNKMTQEELAEKMNVSRQTISKWELDSVFPEMEKVIHLSQLFSCSIDELMLSDMVCYDEAYINIRVEEVPAFRYVKYAVISEKPEDDALKHIWDWAVSMGIEKPEIIGWDFPFLSQEQINVFHMHGYETACILQSEMKQLDLPIIEQKQQKYVVITIKEPFKAPFTLIPNAYKTLGYYIEVNGLRGIRNNGIIPCFEKVYEENNIAFMDVYIAIE